MSVSDFSFPVSGVTGTAFRDKMKEGIDALLTTNSAVGDPTITKAGMLQIKQSPTPLLRVRNTTDTAWVTLLPDITKQYGGLTDVISGNGLLTANNAWSGVNTFDGSVSFNTLVNLGSAGATVISPTDLTNDSTRVANTNFVQNRSTQLANVAVSNLQYFGKSFIDAAYPCYLGGKSVLFTGFPTKARHAKAFMRVVSTAQSYGYPVGREIEMDGVTLSYADDAVVMHVSTTFKFVRDDNSQVFDVTAVNQINTSFVFVLKAWY